MARGIGTSGPEPGKTAASSRTKLHVGEESVRERPLQLQLGASHRFPEGLAPKVGPDGRARTASATQRSQSRRANRSTSGTRSRRRCRAGERSARLDDVRKDSVREGRERAAGDSEAPAHMGTGGPKHQLHADGRRSIQVGRTTYNTRAGHGEEAGSGAIPPIPGAG
jgi:hypothetical protein